MFDTTPVLMLAITVHQAGLATQDRLVGAFARLADARQERLGDDRGQATTEYALVLLAAALVALLVVAWATAGGGAARISRLFNRVIDSVIDRV
jgi:hypothetical protein